jgi:hypothetical protein
MNEPLPEDIEQAATILRTLKPGFLPRDIFLEVARLCPTLTIELAPLRKNENGNIEIFLTQRPADDPYWSGQWHIPGTVIRSTDEKESFKSGFERILKDEAANLLHPISEPIEVSRHFWDIARGCEYDVIHYVFVEYYDNILPGKFFSRSALPEDIIEHHHLMIREIFDSIYDAASS